MIAALTTSYARIHLYKAMAKIKEGDLQYVGKIIPIFKELNNAIDTDSLIFGCRGENPLGDEIGDFLGEFTSEIKEGSQLVEVAAPGPKTYSYKTVKNGQVDAVIKCKGFRLTESASELITFQAMKSMAKSIATGTEFNPITVNYRKISKNRAAQLFNSVEQKKLRPTFSKRRPLPSGSTLPFGYCE